MHTLLRRPTLVALLSLTVFAACDCGGPDDDGGPPSHDDAGHVTPDAGRDAGDDDDAGVPDAGAGATDAGGDDGGAPLVDAGDDDAGDDGGSSPDDAGDDAGEDDAGEDDAGELPPAPEDVAPPNERTRPTDLASSVRFLWEGSPPIQRGVEDGAIDDARVAVLRGRVRAADGEPLAAVRVEVHGAPQLGHTLTRADGVFDLAVNGGGVVTLDYTRTGYLPAQRQLEPTRRGWDDVVDVVLVPLDPVVTEVTLGAAALQTARGSVVEDDDGARQATVLVPAGTTAELVLPDGSTSALSTMHVRATEYTVGERGPEAMPGLLPPATGYTYAVELSLDEALAAGASDVRFNRPLPFYLDNFLGFPVGGAVPVGYYDRARAAWVPSANGRVIEIMTVEDGVASIDLDGDGAADHGPPLASLGVDEDELRALAALYPVGMTLWRVPMTHFTPWDCNWPRGPPEGAERPQRPRPVWSLFDIPDDCEQEGSVIECASQVLGERIGVPGTPYSLVYGSDRVPGRRGQVKISLTGDAAPEGALSVEAIVRTNGQTVTHVAAPAPNLSIEVPWDGKDRFGRPTLGGASIDVTVRYGYPAVYYGPAEFESAFASYPSLAIAADRARNRVYLEQRWFVPADEARRWDGRGLGVGGWSLDVHHVYDTSSGTLYLGTGEERRARNVSSDRATTRFAGQPSDGGYAGDGGLARSALLGDVQDLVVGPDGSLFLGDADHAVIRRVRPDGVIETVVGTGDNAHPVEGAPATASPIGTPGGIAIAPDGSLYFVDSDYGLLMRVTPEGLLERVAGQYDLFCVDEARDDEADARETGLCPSIWSGLVVTPDGTVYLADTNWSRVVAVHPDGVLRRIGGSDFGFGGDGGRVFDAQFDFPQGLALGPDGALYIADTFNNRVRRVGMDGIITTVAGGGVAVPDEVAATDAALDSPYDIAVDADGALYVANDTEVLRVGSDGVVTRFAGAGGVTPSFGVRENDGGPSLGTYFGFIESLAVKDGVVYVNDYAEVVWAVQPSHPYGDGSELVVPSEDAGELYVFDAGGRHLRTLHGLTLGTLRTFEYDDAGYLIGVVDGDGNATVIERDGSGTPTAIVGPFGARTALSSEDGYLTGVSGPSGGAVALGYGEGGLLTSLTEPTGHVHSYSYDSSGRLLSDDGPLGEPVTLAASDEATGARVVEVTSGEGDPIVYRSETHHGGARTEVTFADGTGALAVTRGPESRLELADGRVLREVTAADPRWGLQSPWARQRTKTLPSGASATASFGRSVVLADPADPFSLTTLTLSANVNGRVASWSYDASLRRVTRTFAEGQQIVEVLDPAGRLVERSRAGLATTVIARDQAGRITTVTRGARETVRGYGPSGYLASAADASGATTTYARDAAGRLLSVTSPESRVVAFGYDAGGQVTSVTTPSGAVHGWTRTAYGLPASYVAPGALAGTTSYRYRGDRLLDRVTFADGRFLDYVYDANRRLTALGLARGALTLSYDETTGTLSSAVDPSGVTTSYTWDGDLVTGLALSGPFSAALGVAYDEDLAVASRTLGALTITYQYDDDKRLVGAGDLVISHAPDTGLVSDLFVADGDAAVSELLSFTPFAELAAQAVTDDEGGALFTAGYSYDDAGRLIGASELLGGVTTSWAYEYDDDGRLLRVRRDGALVDELGWDDNGNLATRTRGADVDTGAYAEDDRVLSFGDVLYTSSAAGDRTARVNGDETTLYEYDERGDLLFVTLPDGREIGYLLDARGRRAGKRVDGALTQGFVYDEHGRLFAELDGSGALVSLFVYGHKRYTPDLMLSGGELYRVVTDVRGSLRLVVHVASGSVVRRVDYDALGAIVLDTNPGLSPFGFAGGLYDEDTGLVRLGRRDYDPELGRFTTKDPLGFKGGDWNLYRYGRGDPVSYVDPRGTLPFAVPLIIAGVAAIASKLAEWNEERKLLDVEREQAEAVAARIDDAYEQGDYDYLNNFYEEDLEALSEAARAAKQRCIGHAAELASIFPGTTITGPPPSGAADVIGDATKDAIFAAGAAYDASSR